jgi:hypothetical protein
MLQPVASSWLRAAHERQLEIEPRRYPVHMPVPAPDFNSSRRRDYTPYFDINQITFGNKLLTHDVISPQHTAIHPT